MKGGRRHQDGESECLSGRERDGKGSNVGLIDYFLSLRSPNSALSVQRVWIANLRSPNSALSVQRVRIANIMSDK